MTESIQHRVLVFTTRKDIMYKIVGVGEEVTVEGVTKAVEECEGKFFRATDDLSIVAEDIVSIEIFVQELTNNEEGVEA